MSRAANLFIAMFVAAVPCGSAALAQDGAESIDFSRYAASAATLTAVASAASLVSPCSVPLSYTEIIEESYAVLELTVACLGEEDEEAAVILRFDMLDNGTLLPQSYEFAG